MRLLPIHWPWLAVAAFLLQRAVTHDPGWPDAPDDIRRLVFLATNLAALLFAWANRHLLGMWVLGLGLFLNLVVMAANGGFMPVSPQAIATAGLEERVEGVALGEPIPGSKDVLMDPDQTKLRFISDVIVIKRPFPITNIVSPGDVLIALGVVLALGQFIVVPLMGATTWAKPGVER